MSSKYENNGFHFSGIPLNFECLQLGDFTRFNGQKDLLIEKTTTYQVERFHWKRIIYWLRYDLTPNSRSMLFVFAIVKRAFTIKLIPLITIN